MDMSRWENLCYHSISNILNHIDTWVIFLGMKDLAWYIDLNDIKRGKTVSTTHTMFNTVFYPWQCALTGFVEGCSTIGILRLYMHLRAATTPSPHRSVCPAHAARCKLVAYSARVLLLPTSAPFCNFQCNSNSTNTTLTSATLDTRQQVAESCSKFKRYWCTCIFLLKLMRLLHSLGFKLGFIVPVTWLLRPAIHDLKITWNSPIKHWLPINNNPFTFHSINGQGRKS